MTEPIEPGTASALAPVLPQPNEAGALEEVRERADTVWTRGPGRAPAVGRVGTQSVAGVGGRVAIVDGCRTPFSKSGTDLADMDVVDLSGVVAAELVTRSGVDPEDIGLSIWGVVVPALHAPNLGREVVFRASLPMEIPGTTVNLACASSNRAITWPAAPSRSPTCRSSTRSRRPAS